MSNKREIMTEKQALLTCKQAAEYLNLPLSRIRYETFLKRIPHVKIGRSVRFIKEALDQWVQNNVVGGNSND